MKLRNKKTGEIIDFCNGDFFIHSGDEKINIYKYGKWIEYNSLAQLNAEWEDYEEPKNFWYICGFEVMPAVEGKFSTPDLAAFTREEIAKLEDIGNYFETEEEAEKAVEKLKAWTRLKDKGVIFKGWFWDKNYGTCIIIGDSECSYVDDSDEQNKKDLDLLFSGEDN